MRSHRAWAHGGGTALWPGSPRASWVLLRAPDSRQKFRNGEGVKHGGLARLAFVYAMMGPGHSPYHKVIGGPAAPRLIPMGLTFVLWARDAVVRFRAGRAAPRYHVNTSQFSSCSFSHAGVSCSCGGRGWGIGTDRVGYLWNGGTEGWCKALWLLWHWGTVRGECHSGMRGPRNRAWRVWVGGYSRLQHLHPCGHWCHCWGQTLQGSCEVHRIQTRCLPWCRWNWVGAELAPWAKGALGLKADGPGMGAEGLVDVAVHRTVCERLKLKVVVAVVIVGAVLVVPAAKEDTVSCVLLNTVSLVAMVTTAVVYVLPNDVTVWNGHVTVYVLPAVVIFAPSLLQVVLPIVEAMLAESFCTWNRLVLGAVNHTSNSVANKYGKHEIIPVFITDNEPAWTLAVLYRFAENCGLVYLIIVWWGFFVCLFSKLYSTAR